MVRHRAAAGRKEQITPECRDIFSFLLGANNTALGGSHGREYSLLLFLFLLWGKTFRFSPLNMILAGGVEAGVAMLHIFDRLQNVPSYPACSPLVFTEKYVEVCQMLFQVFTTIEIVRFLFFILLMWSVTLIDVFMLNQTSFMG